MLENYKQYLTKKNIFLTSVIIICMILILTTALNLIFPDNNISTVDKNSSEKVIENFIEEMNKDSKKDLTKYMVEGWDNKSTENLFMGIGELEKLEIKEIKNDKYVQYCKRYVDSKEKSGYELGGNKHTSFTVNIEHTYKKKSKYKNEIKELVFLMEKGDNGWRIITFGTKATIDSLI